MAKVHGRKTVIMVDTITNGVPSGSPVDISQYCDNSQLTTTADVHETTSYGADYKAKDGGLAEGQFTVGGVYDSGDTDTPAALFEGKAGSKFEITRRLGGTGAGLPQQKFVAVLADYQESAPVSDYVRWTSTWQVDGAVDYTPQAS